MFQKDDVKKIVSDVSFSETDLSVLKEYEDDIKMYEDLVNQGLVRKTKLLSFGMKCTVDYQCM